MSGRQYEKAAAVIDAPRADPEKVGKIGPPCAAMSAIGLAAQP